MTTTHPPIRILSGPNRFEPRDLTIQAGDSVVWSNETTQQHTATALSGATFDTGTIEPGAESEPVTFSEPSDHSGIQYFCVFHPGMRASLIVTPASTFTPEDWREIARIVAANWVYDMADDFQNALSNLTGDDRQRVEQEWNGLVDWWHAQLGATQPIANREILSQQERERLEELGRRLRTAYIRLRDDNGRPLLARSPDPGHSGNGQSSDPFGKAITVFDASDEVLQAYTREIRYVGITGAIEEALVLEQDIGSFQPIYASIKAGISVDDYHLLARHQKERLQMLFQMQQFDATQFADGIWRMTLTGEWDQPEFSLWHWLRWLEVYLGVLDTDQIIDLVDPTVFVQPMPQ